PSRPRGWSGCSWRSLRRKGLPWDVGAALHHTGETTDPGVVARAWEAGYHGGCGPVEGSGGPAATRRPVMAPLPLRLLMSRRAWAVAVGVSLALATLWRLTAYPPGMLVRLDASAPYRIELGRGSGLHGLDTVTVLQDGTVTLYRMR